MPGDKVPFLSFEGFPDAGEDLILPRHATNFSPSVTRPPGKAWGESPRSWAFPLSLSAGIEEENPSPPNLAEARVGQTVDEKIPWLHVCPPPCARTEQENPSPPRPAESGV